VQEDTKMRIFKTVLVLTLMYGTESVTILDKHKNRKQASEMKYLRKVNGKSRLDQIRNNNKKPTKARISRSIDGKENVEMVWTRSKDGFENKTKITAGGKTRRRKR
jgi:hypothetical protein